MIAICPNPFRDIDLACTLRARDMLKAAGFDSVICPVFSEDQPDIIPPQIPTVRLEDAADKCTLLLVIGGDGTMLAVARKLRGGKTPILGVNLGTKGFMTALEPNELEYAVDAAAGYLRISRRMKLDVSLCRGGEIIYTDCALNDAVLHGYGDCIKMEVRCNGDLINSFSGDGIVLSTPTGSTGYSMSAGGPIVEPDAENIIISPICAHSMGSKSFVLGPDREVAVKMEKLHVRRAYLSVDGNAVIDLANNDVVSVKRSEDHTRLASMGLRSFYEIAYEKLR